MNIANIGRVPAADVFPQVEPPMGNGVTQRISHETLCERILMAVTSGLSTFLTYVCYHALQHYGVM